MLKKLRLLFFLVLGTTTLAHAQVGQGGLKGKVVDAANGEPVPFANVVVEINGNQAGGATTDFDGNFFIKPLAPGKYDVKTSFVGYQQQMISGVLISADKTQFITVKISQGIELKAFEKVEYEVPLISKDQTTSGGTITREDIVRMPGRSAEAAALTVGGIYSEDGERGSVRGAREEATDTYIDGVKVRGSTNIPNQAIEQVSVMMGGVPAQYGDATGGIISITTRGASSTYFGGFELVSSQLTDPYNYNLLGYTVSGPLLMKRDTEDTTRKKPLLGFFLSGELRSEKDPRPSPLGSWKVRDGLMDSITENPLRPVGTGAFQSAELVRGRDLEKINARQNVEARGALIQGKLDFNTSAHTHLSIGANLDYNTARENSATRGTVYNNSLFNSLNNPLITNTTWRVYSNFTHRFGDPMAQEGSSSVIKNAYYSLQLDYSRFNTKYEDEMHRDKYFNYGHIGKFTSDFVNNYSLGYDSITGLTGLIHDNFRQTLYDFDGSNTSNPILANYTQNYYDLHDDPTGNYENPIQVLEGGGLLNGNFPRNMSSGHVYGLWNSPGMPYNGNTYIDRAQFRMRATGSADIKNHAILIGFEYEQRSDRMFSVDNPYQLWQLNRLLANRHITELDKNNPQVEYDGSVPRITYNRLNSSPGDYNNFNDNEKQSFFDFNLRNALGLDPDGVDFLDVDSYDPDNFRLDMYSANELLNEGNSYVSYYGYTHDGDRLKGKPSFDDFFNKRDDYGNLTREIGAFQPIYMSGYIQDKFSFEDLVFNIGVRVDRFDANQKVLKDPYSFYETRKARELSPELRPNNIGDDFVVYVDDINADASMGNASVVGFRDGDVWYNAEGVEIGNPSILETPEGIAPWLLNAGKKNPAEDLSSDAFVDYTPQVIVMPRIAFSFPISDEALFFAHYDVLAKRPGVGFRLDPTDYLFINSRGQNPINNPNLKPEQTITYELGFQQKISQSSSLKLSAFYNEMRNMVQVINVDYAYPKRYVTYGNIDFGTVKGMTVSYDLRRTGNVSLRAAYTLQFAEGTGSNANTGLNMINAGQPNLRAIYPLDFDQRHNITTAFDFRFGSGRAYNGPVWFDKQIFANTGLNIIGRVGSGTPYSQQANITPQVMSSASRGLMKGNLNGARKPWQSTFDIRLDRDINLKWGRDEEKKKSAMLNVYVLVLNALDRQNILRVYRATGNPDDDGYLNAPQFQVEIDSQTDPIAFMEQYALKVNDPRNFSLPRRIRLGIIMNF
jgi:hypothetical protein